MAKAIGIDLGTTNSVAAIVDGPQPRILDNKEGKPQTPSVVGLRKKGKKDSGSGETVYGQTALDNYPVAPTDTMISIKRLMGRGISDPEVEKVRKHFQFEVVQPSDGTRDGLRVIMGGKEYSPVDISSMILQKIKEDAEFRLGDEVTHAVITVPAYFGQIQKDATRKAAVKAGLKVIKILDEPTAAAIAFGLDSGASDEAKTILVYDLGGGTFDVSILMWANNVFAPLNLEGDMWLGGDNFDQVIMDYVIRNVVEEHGIDPRTIPDTRTRDRFMAELKKKAREAKERLSSARSADVIIPGLLRDSDNDILDIEVEISRAEFERMITPLVDRTESLVDKAIENANLTADQIDFVLMAGNSTAVPLVQASMEKKFGPKKTLRNMHPKLCVAMGAAVLAARSGDQGEIFCYAPDPENPARECGHRNPADANICEKCGAPLVIIGNIAPFSYGTQSAGDRFHIFIKKGDMYPTEDPEVQTFYTRKPNQRIIAFPVFGGENPKASENERQGEAIAILPHGLARETPVHIRLWLDSDGIFDISAQLDNGFDLKPWVIQTGESDAKAVEALEEMERRVEEKSKDFSPEEMERVEKLRNEAFETIKRKEFPSAIRIIEEIGNIQPAPPLVTQQVENILRYLEFVLREYQWALNPEDSYRLANLTTKGGGMLNKGCSEAELLELQRVLENEAERLPELVRALIGMKGALFERIQPHRPKEAAEMMKELADIEGEFKAGRGNSAGMRLNQLVEKMVELIRKIGETSKDADKCGECGAELHGQRLCPKCGADSWLPTKKSKGTSSSQIPSRL